MQDQQDKIKTYLQFLDHSEQFHSTSYHPGKHFNPLTQTRHYLRHFDQSEDITDWQNNKNQNYQTSLPKISKSKQLQPKSQSMDMTNYKSSLLEAFENRRQEESHLISPVIIKFNASSAFKSPRKAQLMYHRILHNEEGRKIENPEKLRNLLHRLHPRQEKATYEVSPPKTQRCSGILRLLKKRQKVRIYRKRQQNPDALKGIRLH